MTLRLQIQKKMLQRSPRVKALDFHIQNSWIIFGLYSGTLGLYDYSTNTCIRTIQASAFPVRAVRFIPKNQWVICGSDDFHLRVFNYNTMEKVKEFKAHADFIRGIIVHLSEPYVISCSDEAKIKVWNYQKDFSLIATLQEHKHFVMAITFNPRDLTKFASGSMDKTIKIWNLTSEGKANMTLTGHKSGVNCLDFYKGDRPHIASGSDDRTIKIWDYQTKQCLHTLTSYTLAISTVTFHPQLPILISTGQQGRAIIHHTNSYSILNTLEYNLGMGWTSDVSKQNSNIIGLGFDEGSVVIRIGSDEPVVSLSNGKVLWTKSMQVFTANLKAVDLQQNKSGDKININSKQLGHTDIYPSYIRHSPNGHYFGLCNQSQFAVIKTASFKSVTLGNGTSLVWQTDSDFAVLQNDVVNIYNNFQYSSSIKLPFVPKKICEGQMLSILGPESILLYDWEHIQKPLHNLNMIVQKIWWNQNGQFMALTTSEKLYLYKFNKSTFSLTQMMAIPSKVTSGVFYGNTFLYMNANGKINFSMNGKSFFLKNYEKKKFILGIVQQQNRLYLFDKTNALYSVHLNLQLFNKMSEYLTKKGSQLPQIPEQLKDTMAKVLHEFGFTKQAYKIVINLDHKFEMALQLGLTRQAYKIASSAHSIHKIRLIGDICLKKGEIQMAIQCYDKVDDLNSLLMIYSSLSLPDQLEELGKKAEKLTKMNIAYMCYYLTNQPNKCVDVLLKSKKYSQAALFSRTYCPDRVTECVKLWKQSITDKRIANKISYLNDEEGDQQEEEEQEAEGSGENEDENEDEVQA